MDKPAFWLANLGVAWCALMGWVLMTKPVYGGTSETVTDDGTPVSTQTSATLAEVNGDGVLFALAVPLVIALAAWVGMHVYCKHGRKGAMRLAYGASTLFLVLCIISGFSIGLFYMPAAAVLFIAASVTPRGGLPAR